MAALLTPETVLRGRYRITGLVGQGGMGAVYMADDLRLEGRRTAIKEIALESYGPADDAAAQQARSQFQREASTLARLDHPNLPKVSDFFVEANRDYLVMDYVPGRDLREILGEARAQGKFLPEPVVRGWAEQIGGALAYLHSQEIAVLHRDIKPGNIKLTPEGRIKLVDFGLVKVMAPDDDRTITVLQGRGTVAYTPLEQYGGDSGHTDPRSDIYSFAATLYHLLTGELPADAKERFLRPGLLRRARDINPSISPQMDEALAWGLEMHPEQRPATVQEFVAALARGVSRQGGSTQVAPDWDQLLAAERGTLFLLAALVAIATVLTALLR